MLIEKLMTIYCHLETFKLIVIFVCTVFILQLFFITIVTRACL